ILQPQAPTSQAGSPAWKTMLEEAGAHSAWVEMAALWPGMDASEVARACGGEIVEGLVCLRLRGNWAFVEEINLPVILRLSRPADAHVLLAGMNSGNLVLRHGGQDWRVPRSRIDRRWRGDLLVAWPDPGVALKRGDSGALVERMKYLATQSQPEPWTGAVNATYDEPFRDWVMAFQRRHGLNEDGVIGPATRLFLRAPHDNAPILLTDQNGA
ncbi:MAG TPA: peptidoglycan-binding domain-containing protein, partial [Wenzhouxiangella sp.]|nr:peptidoglycan-binding domain-containing protein [Wenzhouxiangella sp.]